MQAATAGSCISRLTSLDRKNIGFRTFPRAIGFARYFSAPATVDEHIVFLTIMNFALYLQACEFKRQALPGTNSHKMRCILCPVRIGAFKRTVDGEFQMHNHQTSKPKFSSQQISFLELGRMTCREHCKQTRLNHKILPAHTFGLSYENFARSMDASKLHESHERNGSSSTLATRTLEWYLRYQMVRNDNFALEGVFKNTKSQTCGSLSQEEVGSKMYGVRHIGWGMCAVSC